MVLCFLLVLCSTANAAVLTSNDVGALVFQPHFVSTQQLAPLIRTLHEHAEHVALCQVVYNEESARFLMNWSKESGIPVVIYEGHRNECIATYRNAGGWGKFLLLDWNTELDCVGPCRLVWNQLKDQGVGYAADVNGAVLDWTPLLMRSDAHCGYLGRMVCVDNAVAHRQLLSIKFELDVDAKTRQTIEEALVTTHPTVLRNVTIRRSPPTVPGHGTDLQNLLPPADHGFGHGWHWLGRSLDNVPDCKECPNMARDAYLRRFQLHGTTDEVAGEKWYAAYRLGSLSRQTDEGVQWLLEAYNREPRRREPLAALARLYRTSEKPSLCLLFGMAALAIPFPGGTWPPAGPHVELQVYEWSIADDVSLCMTMLGQHARAASMMSQVLSHNSFVTLPAAERARMEKNLAWLKEQK